jgi:hypothetical protein
MLVLVTDFERKKKRKKRKLKFLGGYIPKALTELKGY